MLFQQRTTLLQSTDKANLMSDRKASFLKDLGTNLRKHAVRCAPQFRFYFRKDRVAQLNFFQFLQLFQRNLVCGFESSPCVQKSAELFQVSVEALLRVVSRGLGGNQELPVRRFQQQQFAAN